jgi:hypothetical protein
MIDTTLAGLAAAPVITALVAVIGQAAPSLPRRLYPLLAVALGVAWTVGAAAAAGNGPSWRDAIDGVVVGLAASGLYSGAVKPAALALRRAS